MATIGMKGDDLRFPRVNNRPVGGFAFIANEYGSGWDSVALGSATVKLYPRLAVPAA
jgi:hypothetical protein